MSAQYNKRLQDYTPEELTKELARREGVTCYRTRNTWSMKANSKHCTGHGKAILLAVRLDGI